MQLNKNNFLRWFNAAPSVGGSDIPVAYWRDCGGCGSFPIAVPGETMSWYMNTLEGLAAADFPDFSDLRLALVRANDDTVVNNNAGALVQHFIDAPDNDFFNIYCTLVVPVASSGIHYFRIYEISTGDEVFRSSYVWVRTDVAELQRVSVFARFRHDRYFYGIKYGDLPGFYQQFRLMLNQIERQYEGDKEVYKEITTGKQRTLQNYLSRFLKIETYYFDQAGHSAAAVMVEHKTLQFNGKDYVVKSAYKEPSNPLSMTGKGEVELWDLEFSTVNRC